VFITKGVVASTDPTATFDSATGPTGVVFAQPGTNVSPCGRKLGGIFDGCR